MNVKGLVWLGIQTERFDEMDRLFRVLFGTPPPRHEFGFSLWTLPNGDLVEVFQQGDKPTFANAPVVGFQVEDLELAKREIVAAGAEIVGGYGPNEDGYESVHFRAPDGNVYELVHDPMHETRAAG